MVGDLNRWELFDRYVIQSELASGGMGVVYRAVDRASGEARALKRIRPEALGDPTLLEAFEREYQVLAGIDHPRIIRVFDYGVDARGPYYTMELLEGQDLTRAMRSGRRLQSAAGTLTYAARVSAPS